MTAEGNPITEPFELTCLTWPNSCREIAIDFAFVLLRTLEKYSQSQEYIHVRKKKNRRRQRRRCGLILDPHWRSLTLGLTDILNEAEQAEFDEEEAALEDSMPSYQEHRKTFRQFEEVSPFLGLT